MEFFGWTSCLSYDCLQSVESFDECLKEHVSEYQTAKAKEAIEVDSPLFVRLALIHPDIFNGYKDKSLSSQAQDKEAFHNYLRALESNSKALAKGLHLTITPTPAVPLERLFPTSLSFSEDLKPLLRNRTQVVLDTEPTEKSPFTYIKTAPRTYYDSARSRMESIVAAMKGEGQNGEHVERQSATPPNNEILLYNDAGEITEGSVSSVYFFRDGRWVTPPVGRNHGGLPGVGRRWALEHELCVEQVVRRDDIKEGEEVWLSNGVRGFIPATIVWTNGR